MRLDVFLGLNRGSRFTSGPASIAQPEAIATVAKLVHASGFPGATIVPSFGVWEGSLEPGLVVTFLADAKRCGAEDFAIDVTAFVCRAIQELRQDTIIVSGPKGNVECNVTVTPGCVPVTDGFGYADAIAGVI